MPAVGAFAESPWIRTPTSSGGRDMVAEFKAYVMKGNVVDLAVAVIMGAAFGAVITSLVKDVFTPLIAAIVGQPDFGGLAWHVRGSAVMYGAFLNALIAFVLVAVAVFFFLIKPIATLQVRMNRNQPATPAPTPEDVV